MSSQAPNSFMRKYNLINGCRLDETLCIFEQLMRYPNLILDMVVAPELPRREVVLCVFDYAGLKTGLEIDSLTGDCMVCCFIFQRESNTTREVKCSLGKTTYKSIINYLDSREFSNPDFKDFYKPNGLGLGGFINMTNLA